MIKTTCSRYLSRLAVAGVMLAIGVGVGSAQDAPDNRWLPWTGCWLAEEQGGNLLCVQQAEGGVEFLSVGEEGVVSQESIIADGQPRTIDSEDCEGSTTARFSEDGERIYLREEVDCAGQRQVSTGLIAMISPGTWVDIRGLEDGRAVWSQSFRRVTDEFATSRGFPDANNEEDFRARLLRWQVSEPSDLNDLREVLLATGPTVTQAWVVEQLEPFPLDADALLALRDDGVPGDVIDVVVAHAFPDEFRLANNATPQRRAPDAARTAVVPNRYGGVAFVGIDPFYAGGYWSPWGFRAGGFHPYGYRSWDRWGYGYGGYGWGYRERIIIVERNDDDTPFPGTGSNGLRPRPGGGYASGNGGSSGAQPRASVGTSSRPAAVSGGGVSGGRSTGRTAKPRRTGGGEGLF